jgi:hypothetical protein
MWGRHKGPNLVDTDELDAFFDRLDHMNLPQILSLHAAWQSIDHRTHEDAWTSVRALGAKEGLTREINRVRDKALGWATRGSNSVPYYRVNDDSTWQQVKMEAGEAIVDAALAVALGSRLGGEAHDTLIAPWLQATGANDADE